jgi:predicted NBD/HSP70 family sugar kinase
MKTGSERLTEVKPAASPRRVGRPRTTETGGASLALLMGLVRNGMATTRLDLERQAELGRAVITDRLEMLETLGILAEGEMGRAEGGRAPRLIRFCEEVGSVLVAVVERSSLAVALTDLAGNFIVEHHEPTELARGPDAILDRLTTLFIWLLDERGGKQQVWGIGLSLPEPVLIDTMDGDAFGIPDLAALKAWRQYDFGVELSLRFGAPSWVRSGVQTMTIGEWKAGGAKGASDVLFVKLGRSICASIVSNGRLHSGSQGSAGLIGHAPTGESSTRICRCGSKGCLEVMASGEAIEEEGLLAAKTGRSRYLAETLELNGEVTDVDVGHGAQLGDGFCAELLTRCGRLVGEAMAPLANLLNPAVVILGGSVAQSGEVLLAAVREALYRQGHPLITRSLRIVRSQLGVTAGLIGSAHVVLDEIFAPASAQEWVLHGSPRKEPAFMARMDAARARSRQAARQPRPPTPSTD